MKGFINYAAVAVTALSSFGSLGIYAADETNSPFRDMEKRPSPEMRQFRSHAVDSVIAAVVPMIADPKLKEMFEVCFPNTLDTTVKFQLDDSGKPTTFVITGDINAMWLRDSSAQVWPYLPYVKSDKELALMIAGLINKQAECILIDPYANAFNNAPEGSGWQSDLTQKMSPWLHERKYELDSQMYPIRLAYAYWKISGDSKVFDQTWLKAQKLVVKTMKEQQRKDGLGSYSFQRVTSQPSDTQINRGYGSPSNPVGLVYSVFRPSDDATQYGFLIPSNMMAVVCMRQLSEIAKEVYGDAAFAKETSDLAKEIDNAIKKYAVVKHPVCGQIYAFEVDGFGNALMMDDANVPSLLAAPYLGYCSAQDPLYRNTRKMVWSRNNPYFFSGKAGEGIGGPHVGLDQPWQMSIIMKGLTSDDPKEIRECLRMVKNASGDKNRIHESFNKDNAGKFTRPWFAWANTLFGELVLKAANNCPEILATPLN